LMNINLKTKKYRSSFYGDNEDEDEISYRRAFVSAEELGDFRKSTKYGYGTNDLYTPSRRLYDFHAGMRSPILGSPTVPSQLPEAEAILPGHTLIRPALGMLKSAVKFPHKDLDNGAGVYGNLDNLGITYGGTGERVLYTGFRRNNNGFLPSVSSEASNFKPRYIIALVRKKPRNKDKPVARFRDYGKLEREKKQLLLNSFSPKTMNETERLRNSKKLTKTYKTNGITLEFFEIPKIKEEAEEAMLVSDAV
ncbi:uncharacterized protein LOC111363329, partial [Spodoptera litura]|uniref:Uncharacterized protein LOC111363329 n=1 Tax=Spodoptera litura TaxID=69820 RepID=A0A9J7EVP2_SPOLT